MRLARLLLTSSRTLALCVTCMALLLGASLLNGCRGADPNRGLLDPTQVGRFKPTPLVVPIVSSLDQSVEEPQQEFRNATDVRAEDLEVVLQDYAIGPGDMLSIAISDLQGPGVETVKTTRVSETGFISLPMIDPLRVTGMSEAQLERAITRAYREARIVENATVSVTVAEARARTYSILGAVNAAGVYPMIRGDFRILDALTAARDTTAAQIEYLYVVRRTGEAQPQDVGGQTSEAAPTQPAATGDLLAPRTQGAAGEAAGATQPAVAGPAADQEDRYVIVEGRPVLINPRGTTTAPAAAGSAVGAAPATQPGGFEFNAPAAVAGQRIIRVPLAQLRAGDLRYNIVIRPQDMILVPGPVVGEYYMAGHVARPGVYSLTARQITLKQAIVSTGMLDQIAIPSRTEIIRRIGPGQELYATVDLDKIWAGEQPDLYLKPNDIVNVGTNAAAPFLAAIRGAFRITYGFGFLYDRNFADDDDE